MSAEVAVPLFLDSVAAGFPSPAQDYIEQSLDLNALCVKRPAATFFVRVSGESMTGAGIYSDDVLVVDRSLTPRHGDIIIAALYGEFTVKELCLRPVPKLLAHNPACDAIELPDPEALEVFGVVTGVVRTLQRG